jgi:hypothetical protein
VPTAARSQTLGHYEAAILERGRVLAGAREVLDVLEDLTDAAAVVRAVLATADQ